MSDTDLEKRLQSIVEAIELNTRNGNTNTFAVAELKAAIKDAGYIHVRHAKEGMPAYSGQEWYARFEKELAGKVFYYLKSDDEVSTTLSICLSAAKRAAGIDT